MAYLLNSRHFSVVVSHFWTVSEAPTVFSALSLPDLWSHSNHLFTNTVVCNTPNNRHPHSLENALRKEVHAEQRPDGGHGNPVVHLLGLRADLGPRCCPDVVRLRRRVLGRRQQRRGPGHRC